MMLLAVEARQHKNFYYDVQLTLCSGRLDKLLIVLKARKP